MGSSLETYNHPTISCRLLLGMARIDVDRNLKQNCTMLTYLSLALKWISNVTSDGHGAIVWNASIAFNTLREKR